LVCALDPGDTGQDPALLSMSQAFDRRAGVAVEDPFPAAVLRFVRSGISRPTLQGEPPAFQDPLPPHDSWGGFFQSHGSSDAWKEFVWKDYMTQPAVLLPVGLAVSAVAISHWDRPLERKWNGVLGGRQTIDRSVASEDLQVARHPVLSARRGKSRPNLVESCAFRQGLSTQRRWHGSCALSNAILEIAPC